MTAHLAALSDRLLSAIVPKTRAAAAYCWYESYPQPIPVCLRRYCCSVEGVGVRCGAWKPC